MHVEENRQATHTVDVTCELRHEADYGALGNLVGRHVADGVPFFRLQHPRQTAPRVEELMSLGASMAASGAVALYHVEDVTPEARQDRGSGETARFVVDDLEEAYCALESPVESIDLVSLGCPHCTLEDIERIARLLSGRSVTATCWVTTSRAIREEAERLGLVAAIEGSGAHVLADTCLIVSPVEQLGLRTMATNSAKAAFYCRAHAGLERRFGTLEQCVEAGVTGRWTAHGVRNGR
jgi:predicted aconitase